MDISNVIQKILSSPGSIAQDLDGSFFVLTNCETVPSLASALKTTFQRKQQLFTPSFFEINPSFNKNFEFCLKIERKVLREALKTNSFLKKEVYPADWHGYSQLNFKQDFEQIQLQIQSGNIEKAVVMTGDYTEWQPSTSDRLFMLKSLIETCSDNLFIYGHWDSKEGVLGATPEILFHRQENSIFTMALAGTLPKLKGPLTESSKGDSLLSDSKELHEHQLVIDDLAEKLIPFGILDRDGPKVIELPHLFHLKTDLTVKIQSDFSGPEGDVRLIAQLHPSSALGLRSKQKPWTWLKTLKGHQNLGHFGAPFGIRTLEGYLCFVAIRNIEWNETGSWVRAGCGIVSKSQPEKEWAELAAKRESVKDLLGLSLITKSLRKDCTQ